MPFSLFILHSTHNGMTSTTKRSSSKHGVQKGCKKQTANKFLLKQYLQTISPEGLQLRFNVHQQTYTCHVKLNADGSPSVVPDTPMGNRKSYDSVSGYCNGIAQLAHPVRERENKSQYGGFKCAWVVRDAMPLGDFLRKWDMTEHGTLSNMMRSRTTLTSLEKTIDTTSKLFPEDEQELTRRARFEQRIKWPSYLL